MLRLHCKSLDNSPMAGAKVAFPDGPGGTLGILTETRLVIGTHNKPNSCKNALKNQLLNRLANILIKIHIYLLICINMETLMQLKDEDKALTLILNSLLSRTMPTILDSFALNRDVVSSGLLPEVLDDSTPDTADSSDEVVDVSDMFSSMGMFGTT